MSFGDNLKQEVAKIFAEQWTVRTGTVVPAPENLKLGNDGVELDATVLYADMADSTGLVENYSAKFAAEVYKSYLHCASKIISNYNGEITAFDGDRVMAVFIGDMKTTRAMRTALAINWAVLHVVNPKLKAQYPETTYVVKHGVGIDAGKLLAARTGVRGSNDLVWVGNSANYAAKLCALRDGDYTLWITENAYTPAEHTVKTAQDGRAMWTQATWPAKNKTVYKSSWWWEP